MINLPTALKQALLLPDPVYMYQIIMLYALNFTMLYVNLFQ